MKGPCSHSEEVGLPLNQEVGKRKPESEGENRRAKAESGNQNRNLESTNQRKEVLLPVKSKRPSKKRPQTEPFFETKIPRLFKYSCNRYSLILENPGASSRDDAIFSGESLLLELRSP